MLEPEERVDLRVDGGASTLVGAEGSGTRKLLE
jgi:hypothetical protein